MINDELARMTSVAADYYRENEKLKAKCKKFEEEKEFLMKWVRNLMFRQDAMLVDLVESFDVLHADYSIDRRKFDRGEKTSL